MKTILAACLCCALLLVAGGCARRGPDVEQAYEAMDAAYEEAATAEAKVQLVKDFLARFPDSEFTLEAAETAVYHLAEELERPAEADALLRGLAMKVGKEEVRRVLAFERLPLLARLGRPDELRAAARRLQRAGPLSHAEASTLGDAAVEAHAWDLALGAYERTLSFATAEAVKKEFQETKLSEERLQRLTRRRQADALAGKGWALANQGRLDEALGVFAAAREVDEVLYTGNTQSSLGSYRGRTLLTAGRLDDAREALAPEALFGGDAETQGAFRRAYAAKNGSEAGFEEFAWATRERLARSCEDFTLPDYGGTPQSFAALRGGEVALLNFWFPT